MERELERTGGCILRELCFELQSCLRESELVEVFVNKPVEPILHCLI